MEYIPLIRFYCTKVLPAVYDDSLSYYEAVCKLTQKLNEVIENDNKQTDAIVNLQEVVKQLQDELEQFKDSGFNDYYKEQVAQWIDQNLKWIFENVAKQVYFGLTLDGYFCAYLPRAWQDISFDTGAVYGSPEYGRLILRWCADNTHIVMQPNTPEKG